MYYVGISMYIWQCGNNNNNKGKLLHTSGELDELSSVLEPKIIFNKNEYFVTFISKFKFLLKAFFTLSSVQTP